MKNILKFVSLLFVFNFHFYSMTAEKGFVSNSVSFSRPAEEITPEQYEKNIKEYEGVPTVQSNPAVQPNLEIQPNQDYQTKLNQSQLKPFSTLKDCVKINDLIKIIKGYMGVDIDDWICKKLLGNKLGVKDYEFVYRKLITYVLPFSKDKLLICKQRGGVYLFDINSNTSQLFTQKDIQYDPINGLFFLKKSKLIVLALDFGQLAFFSSESGKFLYEINVPAFKNYDDIGKPAYVNLMHEYADGEFFIKTTNGQSYLYKLSTQKFLIINIFNDKGGKYFEVNILKEEKPVLLLYMPDGEIFIITINNEGPGIVTNQKLLTRTQIPISTFPKVCVMKSGNIACLTNSEKSNDIEIWDIDSGELISKIIRPKNSKIKLFKEEDFVLIELEDGSLVTVSDENLIEIWGQGYNNLEEATGSKKKECIIQ